MSALPSCSRASQPEICWGEQLSFRRLATSLASRLLPAKRHALGRVASSHAFDSAKVARYCSAPPFRWISRLIVDADRPGCLAIHRTESPCAKLREISSRSVDVSALALR